MPKRIETYGNVQSQSATMTGLIEVNDDVDLALRDLSRRRKAIRTAGWFEHATDSLITAGMLRHAVHDGRLRAVGSKGRANLYELAAVARVWPDFHNRLDAVLAAEVAEEI